MSELARPTVQFEANCGTKFVSFLLERHYFTFGSLLSQFRLSSVCLSSVCLFVVCLSVVCLSVCRLSVCLSSVCNVGAPYSGG